MRGGRIVAHLPISTLGLSIESARLLMIVHTIGAAHEETLSVSQREKRTIPISYNKLAHCAMGIGR
jgi:hypothetical protein